MKSKLLCILHRSPPSHGAAKVGDFIGESKKLRKSFDCKFITIKSSDTIGDIGKVNLKKIYLAIELYFKVFFTLIFFRPSKIYFTASVKGVAFYRDVLLSTLWKTYKIFKKVEVFYHYHTKGVNGFVSVSPKALWFTRFFLKDINLVLLSQLLEQDFLKVQTYKQVLFLPNGVENNFTNEEFENYILQKDYNKINILYLSNMIKSKGYFEVLKLAQLIANEKYHFHFAGGWQSVEDEKEFFAFIEKNQLEEFITFYGFVNGNQKKELFMQASLFIFPTRYKNEALPLSILEALSYGLPVITTNEGSIPFILDQKSGIIVSDLENLSLALDDAFKELVNKKTAYYCRKRYLKHFSLNQFEINLQKILERS